MELKIRYSEKIESTRLLGPGDRAVLWVYGCCFDCPGCIAFNFKHGEYKEEEIAQLVEWFIRTGTDGITISGGEPMLQAESLSLMIRKIRENRKIGVIVYTGFVYEDLLKKAKTDVGIQSFLCEIDLLIDGPYIQELNDDVPYRGSANQRVIALTDRYSEEIVAYYFSVTGRKVEIQIKNDKTLMIGVPSKDQAEIWKNIKALGG